jgi:pilus assembly protein Flp/PilA
MIYQENYPMHNYREALKNLLRDDSGQDLIEYALVAGLISLGAIAVMGPIGTTLATIFGNISTQLTTAS